MQYSTQDETQSCDAIQIRTFVQELKKSSTKNYCSEEFIFETRNELEFKNEELAEQNQEATVKMIHHSYIDADPNEETELVKIIPTNGQILTDIESSEQTSTEQPNLNICTQQDEQTAVKSCNKSPSKNITDQVRSENYKDGNELGIPKITK